MDGPATEFGALESRIGLRSQGNLVLLTIIITILIVRLVYAAPDRQTLVLYLVLARLSGVVLARFQFEELVLDGSISDGV